MTELDIWLMFGVGRITALSKQLSISKQAISKRSFKFNDDVYLAMNKVEQYEMKVERCVKNNILCAAKLVSHESDLIRSKAYFALLTWSEIYGGFK